MAARNSIFFLFTFSSFLSLLVDDSSKYEALCSATAGLRHPGGGNEVFQTFRQVLETPNLDSYTADRAAFLLSGFMWYVSMNVSMFV